MPTLRPARAQYWWAANEQIGDATKAWGREHGRRHRAAPQGRDHPHGGKKRFHVRCVGGAVDGMGPDLTNNGDGTVTDRHSGLMWQRAAAWAVAWEAALPACENLVLAGRDDWRLPNIKELRSINDDPADQPVRGSILLPRHGVGSLLVFHLQYEYDDRGLVGELRVRPGQPQRQDGRGGGALRAGRPGRYGAGAIPRDGAGSRRLRSRWETITTT